MDERAGLNVVLSMPLEAKGWRVTVKVYTIVDNNDELILTDQADLMGLTARKKMAARIAEKLQLNAKGSPS